ncbi:hypothetical protein P7C73_g778, partial [Tremellales sp. Uapishka_1]
MLSPSASSARSAYCQTCSSTLSTNTYLTPCCSSPICDACLLRNPRLKEYVPCLKCGESKSGSGGSTRPRAGDAVGDPLFVLEDEDDLPPSYTVDADPAERGQEEIPVDCETVEVVHQVRKGDTLLKISRQYAADIIVLNSLPPTVLHSHPHLIQTRKTLIVSSRSIPKTAATRDAEKAEKLLKRFQLLTKTVDPTIGKVYLGLESEGSSDFHGEGMEGKKKVPLNEEERALERWFEDDEWERGMEVGKGKRKEGRWNVVGGMAGGGVKG